MSSWTGTTDAVPRGYGAMGAGSGRRSITAGLALLRCVPPRGASLRTLVTADRAHVPPAQVLRHRRTSVRRRHRLP